MVTFFDEMANGRLTRTCA